MQTHLFHDRMLSLDTVMLRRGATLGPNSVILPAASSGGHATVGPVSLVMRGESVPDRTRWIGNPIGPGSTTAEAGVTDLVAAPPTPTSPATATRRTTSAGTTWSSTTGVDGNRLDGRARVDAVAARDSTGSASTSRGLRVAKVSVDGATPRQVRSTAAGELVVAWPDAAARQRFTVA